MNHPKHPKHPGHPGQSLPEFQEFHRWLDAEKGFGSDLVRNALLLQTEMGELAKEILRYTWLQEELGPNDPNDSNDSRLAETRRNIGLELADCLAYLLKLANYTGHDLQSVYTEKMLMNIQRTWKV